MNGLEREVKLSAPQSFDPRQLRELIEPCAASSLDVERLHTVYYDSADMRLARWGIDLRHRAGHGWTVKIPAATSGTAPARFACAFPAGSSTQPPPAALELLRGTLRNVDVAPVGELRTIRYRVAVRRHSGEHVGDVVLDDVRAVEGNQVRRRFRQIEIDLSPQTSRKYFDQLVRALRRGGAGRPNLIRKARFAIGDSVDTLPETFMSPPSRRPRQSEFVRVALASAVESLVGADPHLLLNDGPEWIHVARVATRRLRTDLRVFAALLDRGWVDGLRDDLKRLGALLGKVRDADVLLERVASRAEQLPSADGSEIYRLVAIIRNERESAYRSLRSELRSSWYIELLDLLVAAVRSGPRLSRIDTPLRRRRMITDVLRGPLQKLRKALEQTGPEADAADLHRLRIFTKRCRYACEATLPFAPRRVQKQARRFARRLARLQDQLGRYHDAVIEGERLRDQPGIDRFVIGEIVGLEVAAAEVARYESRALRETLAKRKAPFAL